MAHLLHGHTSKNTPNTKVFKKLQLLTETQLILKTIPFLRYVLTNLEQHMKFASPSS